jgi:hypothetical protein
MWPFILVLARVVRRDAASLGSISGNNLFWFFALLSMQPDSMLLIWFFIGILLLIPSLLTPFAKIPSLRLLLWPLSSGQRRLLQPFAQPLSPSANWLAAIPSLELRQILRTLDFWFAFLLAAASALYLAFGDGLDPEALPVIAMLIVLSFTTLAQNLFTLDGPARQRWKLSPRHGALLLWRKGRWLVAISVLLTIPFAPLAGLAGILAALAAGHHTSVLSPGESPAWRFTTGKLFPHGVLQILAVFASGMSVARGEYSLLAIAVAAYLLSLLFYGWILNRL